MQLLSGTAVLAADPIARDIAAAAGINFHGQRLGSTQGETPVFDFDADGDRDIVLSTHNVSPIPLMRNNGDGTFTEVLSFPKTDRHGCAAADLGSPSGNVRPDGLPDLYCVTGACNGICKHEYPNSLFLQKLDRTFVEMAKAWGVDDPHGRGRVSLILDYNKDGLLDIVLVNDAPSQHFATPSHLYKNVGGRFLEITGGPLNTETYSRCGKAADLDGNGWTDLALCTQKTSAVQFLTFKNDRGTGVFKDITASTAYKKLRAREFELADVNGDKRLDLLVVEAERFSVWLNVLGKHPMMNYSRALDLGRDVAVGDVNRDGAPDIYIAQGMNGSFQDILLINNGSGASYHVSVNPLPRLDQGDSDVVTAIPSWRNTGRAAFLISNGKWATAGPYQLIVFSAE